MRIVATVLAALAMASAHAERILLVPLDSRPAAGQFAQMIGNIAGVDVRMPPYETLGRFTVPGQPDAIMDWLRQQDMTDVTAIVASTDMLCYGGLIASRDNTVSTTTALARVKRFVAWAHRFPNTKLYAFSSIMRLVPTATKQAAPWRMQLATYYEMLDKWQRTGDRQAAREMNRVRASVPAAEMAKYEATRSRDLTVQKSLVDLAGQRQFDYLIIGQDDAKQYGPFVQETANLKRQVTQENCGGLVYFCEGIDQHAATLVSRAILKQHGWTPRVRVIYSDPSGRNLYADYESKPIEDSLRDQLYASGARPADPNGDYDYTLYLNTPGRREESFQTFLTSLEAELDQGFPVAVADINFSEEGAADPELYRELWRDGRMMKLLAYAGWNTAGNTMGTSIPAANVYLMSRQLPIDPLRRELAQKEFLLHRLVNDFAYHKYTRPQAYVMISSHPGASREETYGAAFNEVNDFVRRDLTKQLQRTFQEQFLGKRFFAGTEQYEFSDLTNVKVFLPWPRAYEVRMSFNLSAKPVP